MEKSINKIINILAAKHTVWFLFSFAVLLYSYQVLVTSRVGNDSMRQLETAVNFIDGNGFVAQSSENLNEINSSQVLDWPYFYRILAVPVLFFTGSNVELSSLILGIIAFAFLLVAIWCFIKNIDLQNKNTILGLIFIFSAVSIAPLKYMGASDMFALGFSLLALIFLLNIFKDKNQIKYNALFFITIALLPQIRYAYVPVSIGFMIFYFIVVLYNKNTFQKRWLFSLSALPLISVFFTITNNYFINTTSMFSGGNVYKPEIIEEKIFWLKPFYAPFSNSFFPDFILASFGMKNQEVWNDIAYFAFLAFAVFSVLILIFLLINYFKESNSLKKLFALPKLPETALFILIGTTLLFYIFLYRNSAYSFNEITSTLILHEKLDVVNRYFGPIHVATYLLAIIYIVKYNSKFFKILIFSSVLFGCFHFAYLRTVYHPFNRSQNMDIVNNPEGSYNDIVKIGDIIRNEKKTKNVFYTSSIVKNKENDNYRQVTPYLFAIANGAIRLNTTEYLGNYKPDTQTVLHSNFNNGDFDFTDWEIIYVGRVYSLWKYNP